MNDDTLLSICVPTYNRAETLRSCLFMLCPQVARRPERIELVVCDNASTDHTRQVVEEVRQEWPFVRYTRNAENIGMLRNIDRAVRTASGTLCWLFGDDDVALPYALDKIVETIEQVPDLSQFAFGCTNAFLVDANGDEFLYTTDRHCAIDSMVFERGGEIFAHLDYHSIGHISRLVVNRRLWMANDYDDRRPFEVFSFVRVLIRMAANGSTFFLKAPVVGGRNKHSVAYYANHLALAFTIEFPEFDRLCRTELGLTKRQLMPLMKSRRRLTLRGALKMLIFQAEYAPYLHVLREARFSLPSERMAIRLLYLLLSNRRWSRWPRRFVERRQTNPITTDVFLHSNV